MRIVCISTPTYDLDGAVQLKIDPTSSDLRSNTRRVSRSMTLDGGVAITDGGFSHGDRTLKLRAVDVAAEVEADLWRIFQAYSLVNISIPEGFFSAHIESVTGKDGTIDLSVLIKERLDE